MKKIWKDVIGYEGLYQISNSGKIRNLAGEILTPVDNGNGYLRFSLSHGKRKYETVYLHRALAEAFIPNPNNLSEVNHKDENKLNNDIDNLEWCTPKYNVNYGTRNQRSGEQLRRKIVGTRIKDGSTIQFDGVVESERAGFNKSAISNCLQGLSQSSGGYVWKYSNG